MPDIPPALEVYPVHHLPIIKAYADHLGLVGLIKHYVPTEMDLDAGTVVLGLVLATLSGRRPLYRVEAFFAHQDTELLLGQAVPPQALTDATVGRVLDRLYDFGTMTRFTACAVRASMRFDMERRYVHFDTTSRSVWGDYDVAEAQALPFRMTYGSSKDTRPDLKQVVLSTRCVDRAVPMWGKLEAGNASDKTLKTTLFSEIAQLLARHGLAPGAYIYMADAALVTEDQLKALGDTVCITRLPATYRACERAIAAAVAQEHWEEVGIVAQTKPTRHRPAASYTGAERTVTLSGKPSRVVVIHSSRQDQRRQQRFAREMTASATALAATVGEATHQEYCCRADAEAAAEKVQALQRSYHQVEVVIAERPTYSPGRPRTRTPRAVKAWRYGLKGTRHERSEVIAHKRPAAGCFVLLTNVPTAGEMAHSAGEVLRVYKAQHGIEQHCACLKDPVIVNRLFLKQPERIAALGLVLVLALLVWRLVERALRVHVETTGSTLTGWDKKEPLKPTAFMMMTKFAAVLGLTRGSHRQLAQPLSAVQHAYLRALGVPPTALTVSPSG